MKILALLALLYCIGAHADGDIDPTFGLSGLVTLAFSNPMGSHERIAVQADGKIVACDGIPDAIVTARVNADGSPDTTFGNNGVASVSFPYGGTCTGIAVQTDGKIVVAGVEDSSTGQSNFAAFRLNTDGTLDQGFSDTGGIFTSDFQLGGNEDAWGIAVQPDQNIVLVGQAGNAIAALRLLPNGTYDDSFGTNGRFSTTLGYSSGSGRGYAVKLDSLGRIVIGGYFATSSTSNSEFVALRLTAAGELDTTFNATGSIFVSFGATSGDTARAVALESDDSVVLVGTSTLLNGDYVGDVVHVTSSGTLDSQFAAAGELVIPAGQGLNVITSVGIQSDGKITVAGYSFPTPVQAQAARLNTDGSVDSSFGITTYSLGGPPAGFESVFLQGEELYAGGYINPTAMPGGVSDVITRLVIDRIFGSGFE